MNTIGKKITAITTAALLTIGLAACGNGNTANNTANTANTTTQSKTNKPKEKLNPGNWNAWDIKVKHVKTEPDPKNSDIVYVTEKISIKNLSNENIYKPYFMVGLGTPAGDKTVNGSKGIGGGRISLDHYLVSDGKSIYDDGLNGIEQYAQQESNTTSTATTNWKPGETKTATYKFRLGGYGNGNHEKNIEFRLLKIVHDDNELDDVTSGAEEANDLWDGKYCPGKNEEGTERNTEDQCTEKWGPVFDLKTGKKITDYATGKDMSTAYFEDIRPDDTSDWQANMTDEEKEQLEMQREFLNGNKK